MKLLHPAVKRAVVLGGAGAVGALFVSALRQAVPLVRVVDARGAVSEVACADDSRALQADVMHPSEALLGVLREADIVVACLPEDVMLAAYPAIVGAMREGALLADTLSVKSPLISRIATTPPTVEVLSLNPMFSPSLGFQGQSVAAVQVRSGPLTAGLIAALEGWGSRVICLSADQHDRYTALLQAATHAAVLAFGMTLQGMDYQFGEVEAIMPPPHRVLLALLSRMLAADPLVYWDIQSANPYARQARESLAASLQQLSENVSRRDFAAFSADLEGIERRLGEDSVARLNRYCAGMFSLWGTMDQGGG